jgi:hypothetical protein
MTYPLLVDDVLLFVETDTMTFDVPDTYALIQLALAVANTTVAVGASPLTFTFFAMA